MDRNKQVDIIRGGAILLVVLEHALGTTDNFFARIILSFHMPVFFILSGYLAHEKSNGTFGKIVIKKLKRLLIPQITLAILSFCYNFLIGNLVLHTATASELNIVNCFFRWWFLLVMAQVVVIWEVLVRIAGKHMLKAEIVLLFICVVYMAVVPQGISGPLYIAVTPVAFGYYVAGNLLHRVKKKFESRNGNTNFVRILICIIEALLTTILSQLNAPILMYENTYGVVSVSIVTAFLGYFVLNNMAMLMGENRFLQWCGRNSIIIYVIHFCVVQGVRGVLVRIIPLPLEILGWIVFVVAGLIVIIATRFSEKYVGFAFGK